MNLTKKKIKRACLFTAVLAAAVGIESIAVASYLHSKQLAIAERFVLKADAKSLWASDRAVRGNPNAAYRLVEFGDFQCPPCRAAATEIEKWQASSPDAVCFQFRNFPLTNLHPKAKEYALIAESVGASQYWNVHKDLFQLQVDGDSEKILPLQLAAKQAQSQEIAVKRLHEDIALTEKLDLSQTPTLLLLTPKGRVFVCPGVEYVRKWISEGL